MRRAALAHNDAVVTQQDLRVNHALALRTDAARQLPEYLCAVGLGASPERHGHYPCTPVPVLFNAATPPAKSTLLQPAPRAAARRRRLHRTQPKRPSQFVVV